MSKANYSYVGISFIILLFGIIFVPKIIDRISNDDITREKGRSQDINNTKTKKLSDLVYLENNGEKRKVPEFSFINQDGKIITNKDYLGKVYVLEFFFTSCPTICPRMSRNLVEIQNEFSDFKDFGVASFTINPNYDTPEVLKEYANKYGVTNPNWNFMTGDEDTIYKLANEGFYIFAAKNPDVVGGFEHSGNFALIDKEGYIRSRVVNGNPIIYYNGIISEEEKVDDEGTDQEISILKEDIKKLLNE